MDTATLIIHCYTRLHTAFDLGGSVLLLHLSLMTESHAIVKLQLCGIVSGQKCSKKLKEQQTRKMIKETAKPAYMRRKCIMEKASFLNRRE